MEFAKECTDGECICSKMFTHFSDGKLHNFGCKIKGFKLRSEHISGLQIKSSHAIQLPPLAITGPRLQSIHTEIAYINLDYTEIKLTNSLSH